MTDVLDTNLACEHAGARIRYSVRGDGPPVILIQGVGVHGPGWTYQVAALAARYCCLWFDNRGVGRTGSPRQRMSIETLAADARALMAGQGWRSAHFVGHSMGGLIALELALAEPAAVRSLALLSTFANGRDASPLTPSMIWAGLRTVIGTRRMRRDAFLRFVAGRLPVARGDRDALAARLAPLFGHDLATMPAGAMPQLRAMRRRDLRDRLGEIRGIPTLVVTGLEDRIAPSSSSRFLAAAIADARLVELPGAAHGIPLTHPARVNELLLDHLDNAECIAERARQLPVDTSERSAPACREGQDTTRLHP